MCSFPQLFISFLRSLFSLFHSPRLLLCFSAYLCSSSLCYLQLERTAPAANNSRQVVVSSTCANRFSQFIHCQHRFPIKINFIIGNERKRRKVSFSFSFLSSLSSSSKDFFSFPIFAPHHTKAASKRATTSAAE